MAQEVVCFLEVAAMLLVTPSARSGPAAVRRCWRQQPSLPVLVCLLLSREVMQILLHDQALGLLLDGVGMGWPCDRTCHLRVLWLWLLCCVAVHCIIRCAVVLRDLISPYLLRRRKADVATQLPKKTETVLFCSLTEAQRDLYRCARSQV